jgi:hypothetical protein
LPDDLFNVPQNIVVPKDPPAPLAAVNALIDEVRVSGFLQSVIERGGAIGLRSQRALVQGGTPACARQGQARRLAKHSSVWR